MYRVFLATLALSAIPMAFGQSKPPHILIKANCALADGTVVSQKLIEVDGGLSAEKKRAIAEEACRPVLDDAAAKCDDLSTRVEAMKAEWRRAGHYSFREHQIAADIKKVLAQAPAYCKADPPKVR
jgi:pentose-5-phosphate-3-epimerase